MRNRLSTSLLSTSALMSTAIVLFSAAGAVAETLKTKNYRVKIVRNCPKGNVVCDNVTYYGTNLRTGQSIRVNGKTAHAPCKDGKTPCRFIGYQSQQGIYRGFVAIDGTLQVFQGKRLLIQEKGTWTN